VVAAGVWLRRRLLRGASLIDRQELRRKGAGQLFGLVIEAAAIDALALTGGIVATFALIELAIAFLVLLAGATSLAAPLLLAWVAVVGYLGWRYFARRASWTTDRFAMSEQLLEAMVGHRTRLVQQPQEEWHRQEDEALDQFIAKGDVMDRASLWLTLVPRGWLLLALAALIPALAKSATTGSLAVSIGGILLAYRALQRLVGGFSNLAGAIISARSVAGLAVAANRQEQAGVPSALMPSSTKAASLDGLVAQARDLTFRYRSQGEPVLDNCSVNISRNARLLLEGPSGSGKTTLASIVAGLQSADSGLLLIDGLDRGALGAAGWRNRVTMAPQAHDNYLVSGSLAFNLLMGRRWPAEPADLIEAEKVCRELGLGDLLDRLPAGLHQVVGESGWRLSQGERTRVFLARALLQDPELLILDESFSALDSDNVERAMRCVTNRAAAVLAIAHT
jgi:ATP-binding cassette subfamily B protein